MKHLWLIYLLVLCSPVYAVEIEKANRVSNRKPGYCGWSCIETLAKHHKIEKLYGLVDKRAKMTFDWSYNKKKKQWERVLPNGCDKDRVSRQLKALDQKFLIQDDDNFDTKILENANELGCVIGVKEWNPELHALILVKFTDEEIEFIDTDDCKRYKEKREWLKYHWTGFAVVILK